jgi:Ca2+-binding EF-hand superfamily protein
LPPIYEALIESVFKKLDVDNSGVISEMNLFTLFGLRGYQGTGAAELIKEGDFAGDGVISLSEFFSLVTGHTS